MIAQILQNLICRLSRKPRCNRRPNSAWIAATGFIPLFSVLQKNKRDANTSEKLSARHGQA